MMRAMLIGLIVAPTPATAQSSRGDISAANAVDAARAVVEERARMLDADRDGLISREEMVAGADAVFPSADEDGSGAIDQMEFREWPFGLAEMARFRGREQAFDAAFGMVFDLFDRDEDGQLDRDEFVTGMGAALDYADMDGDGALTRDEFMQGFITNVALRHAMVE